MEMKPELITAGVYRVGKYFIRHARPTGGKAGKGRNKTTSFQITEYSESGYYVLKSYKFKVNDYGARAEALKKCLLFIKSLSPTKE